MKERFLEIIIKILIALEGLDIGEVDLIICYDSQKSPIRLIQRMGRTGRKREGRIIILLTEGKEEGSYSTSLSKKKNIYKTIQNSAKNLKFYQNNPPMMPKDHKPKCHQMFITVNDELNDGAASKTIGSNSESEEVNDEVEDVPTTSKAKKSKAKAKRVTKSFDDEENVFDMLLIEESNDTANENNDNSLNEIQNKKKKNNNKKNDEPIIIDNSNLLGKKTNATKSTVATKATKIKQTTIENFMNNDKLKPLAKTVPQANAININNSKPKENFFNVNPNNMMRKSLVKETTQACFVPDIPDSKLINNINRISNDTFDKIKLDELIKQWQSDDDDFIFGAFKMDRTSFNNSGNYLNESDIECNLNKYQEYYDQFESNVSLHENDSEEEEKYNEDMMEPEYHDIVDDELFEDNLLKNIDLNLIEKKEVIMEREIENSEDVEMKSIINDTLSYDDCITALNSITNNRIEASNKITNSLSSNKPQILSSKTEANPITNNLDKINFFGGRLEDLFNSDDDDDDDDDVTPDVQKKVIDKRFEETKLDSVDNSDEDDKDLLNHLLKCDEILEKIEADHNKSESNKKNNFDKSFKPEEKINRVINDKNLYNNHILKNSPVLLKKRNTSTPLGKISSLNNKFKEFEANKLKQELDEINNDKKQNKSTCSLNKALNELSGNENKDKTSKMNQNDQIMFDMNINMLADLFNDDDDDDNDDYKLLTEKSNLNDDNIVTDSIIIESCVNEKSKSLLQVHSKKIEVVAPLNHKSDTLSKF